MDWYCDEKNKVLIQKVRDFCDGFISFRDLKEFFVPYVTKNLDSENTTIAKLIREIELSVVQVEEDLLTKEEFKSNLQIFLDCLPREQEKWTTSSAPHVNCDIIAWESGNPAPSLTTCEHAFQ